MSSFGDRGSRTSLARDGVEDSDILLEELRQLGVVGSLTTGIAHDLAGLLQIIRGNAELLAMSSDVARECVEPILAAAERGAELIARMMAYARMKPNPPGAIGVEEHVDNVVRLMQATFPKNISIRADVADDVSDVVADRLGLESALLNVSINARDAMPCGGTLAITCRNVIVTETDLAGHPEVQPGAFVLFSVEDTGHGVPSDVLPRIFDRFFTTKKTGDGSGMGLWSVSEFAGQLGGFVSAASEPRKGLKLHLFLPAHGGAHAAGRPDEDLSRYRQLPSRS